MQVLLTWLWYLDFGANLALLASLARNGLYRVYRFFFAYLAADVLESFGGFLFQKSYRIYGEIYFAGQSIKMLLAVFVVLEIYRIALAGRPALARFGRDTVSYVLIAAAVIAVCGMMIDNSVPPGRSPVLHRFNSFERTMDLWMLVFLLLIGIFMSWFPVRLTRNGVLYISGFVLYFLARSLGLLLTNADPALVHVLDAAMLGVAIVCLVIWTVALRQAGEEVTVVTGHRWDPASVERLTGQLDAINARLIRFSRR